MSDADYIAKVATMEANLTHLTSQLGKIMGYLETGSQRGTEQTANLAVIKDNVKDLKQEFVEYRKECTTERDLHTRKIQDIENWQENKETDDERDGKRQDRRTTTIAIIISSIIGAGTFLVEWLKK